MFLDEVDDTPLSFQVKLLRVLEDRTVSRLGENRWRKVDFRILAATNRDLRPLIARGLFGADLFERLAIVSIRLPPLRERLEDLPALTRHMIARFYVEEPAARERHDVTDVTPEALAAAGGPPLAGQHPRAAQRHLRRAGAQARRARSCSPPTCWSRCVRAQRGDRRRSRAPGRARRPSGRRGRGTIDAQAIEAAVAAGDFNLRAAIEALERAAVSAALARTAGNASAAAAAARRGRAAAAPRSRRDRPRDDAPSRPGARPPARRR